MLFCLLESIFLKEKNHRAQSDILHLYQSIYQDVSTFQRLLHYLIEIALVNAVELTIYIYIFPNLNILSLCPLREGDLQGFFPEETLE